MPVASVQDYWAVTGDIVTPPNDILDAIDQATTLLEDELQRPLRSAERTETLELWPDYAFPFGWVYPSATPITAADPAIAVLHPSSTSRVRIQSLPASPISPFPTLPLYIPLTYTGGYTTTTCPPTLRRAIARLAKALTTPVTAGAGLPANAVGPVRVGDVSFTLAPTGSDLDALVPGISITVRGFRKRVRPNRVYLDLVL